MGGGRQRTGSHGKGDAPASKRCRTEEPEKSTILFYLKPKANGENAGPASCARNASPLPSTSKTPAFGRPLEPMCTTTQHCKPVPGTLLQSLQRRFISQQTLHTPAGPPIAAPVNAGPFDDDLDGFRLHSQPTYERGLSQHAFPSPAAEPSLPDSQATFSGEQQAEECEFAFPVSQQQSQLSERLADDGAGPDELAASQLQPQPPQAGAAAAPTEQKTTPLLCMESKAGGEASAVPQSLFPVFRCRAQFKELYLIRHGESEYNAACSTAHSDWADPLIFDAPLTKLGRQQARDLRQRLRGMNLPPETLWVTSPLTRAIETLLLACPTGERVMDADPDGAVVGGLVPGKLAVRSEISEKLVTAGDVGKPCSVLSARFPQIAPALGHLPEAWWYSRPGRTNCALAGELAALEPKESLQRRIAEFKRWLYTRPERTIVAVGHSAYWKEFASGFSGVRPPCMRNCEVRLLHV